MDKGLRFCLGLSITALAGWVDAIGFISLGGFYLSFMTGNTTQLGIGVARFDTSVVAIPAVLLTCFVLGAFVGTIISSMTGRWSVAIVLLLEAVLLAGAFSLSTFHVPIFGPAEPLATAMGAQNAALRNDCGHRIGATFVTGTVFGFGEKIGLWCLRKGGLRPVARHALGWAALATGAVLGSSAYSSYGFFALSIPAAFLALFSFVTALASLGRLRDTAAQQGRNQPT